MIIKAVHIVKTAACNTDTASVETECGPDADDQNVAFYSLFMHDLRRSLQRIPSMARKAILKELIEIEEDTDTEGAVRYSQALPVGEQVILVTSLMDSSSPEELIKGDIRSLLVNSLQLLTYNLLRGQVEDVLRNAQSFSQTYKSTEIVKNVDLTCVTCMAPLLAVYVRTRNIMFIHRKQSVTRNNFYCIFTLMCELCFLESAVQ